MINDRPIHLNSRTANNEVSRQIDGRFSGSEQKDARDELGQTSRSLQSMIPLNKKTMVTNYS